MKTRIYVGRDRLEKQVHGLLIGPCPNLLLAKYISSCIRIGTERDTEKAVSGTIFNVFQNGKSGE